MTYNEKSTQGVQQHMCHLLFVLFPDSVLKVSNLDDDLSLGADGKWMCAHSWPLHDMTHMICEFSCMTAFVNTNTHKVIMSVQVEGLWC